MKATSEIANKIILITNTKDSKRKEVLTIINPTGITLDPGLNSKNHITKKLLKRQSRRVVVSSVSLPKEASRTHWPTMYLLE